MKCFFKSAKSRRLSRNSGISSRTVHIIILPPPIRFCQQRISLLRKYAEIESMNINIDYAYVGYRRENSEPIIVIHTDEQEIVEKELSRKGYKVY